MSRQLIEARLQLVYGKEFLDRISISTNEQNVIVLCVDVHGMHQNAVRHFLTNIINLCKGDFLIRIIHGYNHGTILKDMIQTEKIHYRIREKLAVSGNQGQTLLKVAAA